MNLAGVAGPGSVRPTTHFGWGSLERLADLVDRYAPTRVVVVSGARSYQLSGAAQRIARCLPGIAVHEFVRPGELPTLDDVRAGAELLQNARPELIIAVGGGGVIDLAKAMRTTFSVHLDGDGKRIDVLAGETARPPLVAIPTTAGTGAEVTQFAVVYIDGVKHSIDHPAVLPDDAIVDPSLTATLSPRVTASTGMDALAQSIESIWSVHSTDRSRRHASRAVRLALDNLEAAVVAPTRRPREAMAMAAHLSGLAINQTRTTACHAVSYPMTAHFGVPHGHAVALTLPAMLVFNAQVEQRDVNDPGGIEAVREKVNLVLELLGVDTPEAGCDRLRQLMERISLETSLAQLGIVDLDVILAEGFDPERAGNNPRRLSADSLRAMLA